jgi:histidinol phosphatase-like enzyme (inositol monophosphatase family)
MTGKKELQEMLDFAISITTSSGAIARRYFRTSLDVRSKSAHDYDPVTEADRNIEIYLRKKIHQQYPNHGIIGEEQGVKKGTRYTWVIDPIDGTRGFISGSPMWGSLLGLMENKRPVLGLMHQPFIRETFYASSAGAWWKEGKNISRLKSRNTAEIGDTILYCTHPSMFSSKKELKAFNLVEKQCRYSRYGADCYGYCLLAAGYVDIVIEAGLKAYDIVPLIPIIKASGGVITDWQGKQPLKGGRVIAAANKKLHRQAISLLNSI